MADFINKWLNGLARTRKAAFGRIATVFGATDINAEIWDELEALLIQADTGLDTAQIVVNRLKKVVTENGYTKSSELETALGQELLNLLDENPGVEWETDSPYVVLLVGVNGSGKTTTAAKLGSLLAWQGKKTILGAADTYRAAAVDQLQVWGERLSVPVIHGAPGSDPGAVAYDACQAALARKSDVLIIDTAGRLHTRFNLMEELKKVHRVVSRAIPGAPHATWLVLDATTGQNAFQQASYFRDAVKVNGVILAKLDSSAKGGMVFSIQKTLGLPILFAGLGEQPEDLQMFDRQAFVDSILNKNRE